MRLNVIDASCKLYFSALFVARIYAESMFI
jgi:hypothetical protein